MRNEFISTKYAQRVTRSDEPMDRNMVRIANTHGDFVFACGFKISNCEENICLIPTWELVPKVCYDRDRDGKRKNYCGTQIVVNEIEHGVVLSAADKNVSNLFVLGDF
jgi:hypothetical protein